MAPTPLTQEEWDQLVPYWPKLIRDACGKTDEETGRYNCIAWAFEVTDRWINVPRVETHIDALCITRQLNP